ncbi:MAG TPA: hypothetical protein VNS99_09705, partial [Gaiellales bacterium]|nr:hypothetical protein [Gaiellales bacterium]
EGLGYSHIMIPEDYFYLPALVGATLALQATETVPVGTSIVSGLVRHLIPGRCRRQSRFSNQWCA